MMVTWVSGLFKDIHGEMELDFDEPLAATFRGEIDATGLWTGEEERDAHLRSADFFDVENHPKILFEGRFVERTGDTSFKVGGRPDHPRDHARGTTGRERTSASGRRRSGRARRTAAR